MEMKWDQLLCASRIKPLITGKATKAAQGEARSEFEKDYGRAVFSTPVRRLQDKAQVFPSDPSDVVRTRLTHSQEVSAVSRDLARTAGRWLLETGQIRSYNQVESIESIAATCGIIHDLGNPPFGHSGEAAIRDWFDKKKRESASFLQFTGNGHREAQLQADFLHFEGNAQTIRIVSKLQVLTDLYGLNLTCGTLSAACKYIAASDKMVEAKECKKPGYFASEYDRISLIQTQTGTGDARNPITYLVEASDDIVYSLADIEDAIKKKVITWAEVEGALKDAVREHPPTKHLLESVLSDMSEYIGAGITPSNTSEHGEVKSQVFRTFAMRRTVPSVLASFKTNYAPIMAGEYHKELIEDCSASLLILACQDVARTKIYSHPEIIKREVAGEKVIHDLMDLFWEGVSQYPHRGGTKTYTGKVYHLMSENYRTVFEAAMKEGILPEKYCKLQLVTDYVCGMTDSFAYLLHKQLTNG